MHRLRIEVSVFQPPDLARIHPAMTEVIRRVQMDSGLRRRPVEQVVLDLIGDDGGPLLSHGQSEAEQRSFDATCRKLFRYLTAPEISHGRDARRSTAATNRSRH